MGGWISIHAPREGSDRPRDLRGPGRHDFNPRSPRGERLAISWHLLQTREFQSTLPARGATLAAAEALDLVIFQSTLPARGATLELLGAGVGKVISIHAPREGSDAEQAQTDLTSVEFQSTLPARGATMRCSCLCWIRSVFQSTLPARGATANVHRFLDKICTVCINNRAFFAQCLIQTTSNAESVGKTRCYFGANLQAFIDSLYFALLQNQHFFWHIRGFASKMLYFVFVMVPKIIET